MREMPPWPPSSCRTTCSVTNCDRSNRGTRVRTVITRGDPAKVLVEAARNADLLVIGRRTGRLRSIASRSISRRCASRADCPLVVVRGDCLRRKPVESDTPTGVAPAGTLAASTSTVPARTRTGPSAVRVPATRPLRRAVSVRGASPAFVPEVRLPRPRQGSSPRRTRTPRS